MALRDLQSDLAKGVGEPFVTTPMIDRLGGQGSPDPFAPPPIQGGTDVSGKPLTFPRAGTDVSGQPLTFPRTGTSVSGGPLTFPRTGTTTSPFITGPITGRPIHYTSWTGYYNTTDSFLLGHGANLFSNSPPKLSPSQMYSPQNLKNSSRKGFATTYNNVYIPNQHYQQDGFNASMVGSNTFNNLKIHGLNLQSKYSGPIPRYSPSALAPQNLEVSQRKGFNSSYNTSTYIGNQYYGMDGFNSALRGQPTFNFLKIHGQTLQQKYTGPVPFYNTSALNPQNLKTSTRKGFSVSYNPTSYIGNQYYGDDGFSPNMQGASVFNYLKLHGQNLKSKYTGPAPYYRTIPLAPQNITSSIRTGYLTPYTIATYVGNQYYGDDGFNPALMGASQFNYLKLHGQNLQQKYSGTPNKYSINPLSPQNIEHSLRKGFLTTYNVATYVGNQYYGMDGFNTNIQGSSTFSYLKIHGENLKSKYTNTIPKYSSVGFKDPNILSLQDSTRKGFLTPYAITTYIGNQYYGDDGFNTNITGQAEFEYLRPKGQNLKEKYTGAPSDYSISGMYKIDSVNTTKLAKALGQYPTYSNWIGGTKPTMKAKDLKRTTQAGGNFAYNEDKYYGNALSYGFDLAGGGSSKKPYVIRQIGQTWYGGKSGNPPNTCYVSNAMIRGGMKTVISRTAADVKRASKYIFSGCGALWLVQQFGLQLTNPKSESTLVQGTRIFNPLSTIANIAGAGFGVHIQRHGIPFVSKDYEAVVRFKSGDLLNLWKQAKKVPTLGVLGPGLNLIKQGVEFDHFKIGDDNPLSESYKGDPREQWPSINPKLGKLGAALKKGAKALTDKIASLFGSGNNKTLSSKLAGPHSVYGIGWTNIKRSTIFSDFLTAGLPNGNLSVRTDGRSKNSYNNFVGNAGQAVILANSKDYSAPGQRSQNAPTSDNNATPYKPTDAGETIGVKTYNAEGTSTVNLITAADCKLYNSLTYKDMQEDISRFASDGNQGSPPEQATAQEERQRQLARPYIGAAARSTGNSPNAGSALGKSGADKIKNFYEAGIYGTYDPEAMLSSDPINWSDDAQGNDLVECKIGSTWFMAYLTSLSDKVTPSWTKVDYVGRPDKAAIYGGVERDISFDLMVAALTKDELEVIYKKVNKMVQYCAPSVSSNVMSGQIIKLKLGAYLPDNAQGYITGLTMNIDDSYIWDIEEEVPMYIKLSFGFELLGAGRADRAIPTSTKDYFGIIS